MTMKLIKYLMSVSLNQAIGKEFEVELVISFVCLAFYIGIQSFILEFLFSCILPQVILFKPMILNSIDMWLTSCSGKTSALSSRVIYCIHYLLLCKNHSKTEWFKTIIIFLLLIDRSASELMTDISKTKLIYHITLLNIYSQWHTVQDN